MNFVRTLYPYCLYNSLIFFFPHVISEGPHSLPLTFRFFFFLQLVCFSPTTAASPSAEFDRCCCCCCCFPLLHPFPTPCRTPEAAVPAGRRGSQPAAPGAAQLPPVRPQPGDLGAGAGRAGGRPGRGGRPARLPSGSEQGGELRPKGDELLL